MAFTLNAPDRKADKTEAQSGSTSVVLKGPRLAATRPHGKATLSPVVVRGIVRLVDFLTVTILGIVIAHSYVNKTDLLSSARYLVTEPALGIVTVATFELLGLYTLRVFSSFVKKMPRVLLGWTMSFAALVAVVFFLKIGADVSRVWLATWYVAGAAALVGERLIVAWMMRRWAYTGQIYQRAAIYGTGEVTEDLIEHLEADADASIRIVGIYDDRDVERSSRLVNGYPRLGGIDELIDMARATRLDLIIVSLPLAAEERLTKVVSRLSELPLDIKMPARATGLRFSPRTYSHIGKVAMIDLFDRPIADWDVVSKWLFDKIVGTLALIALAPVMALVALAVKLDSKGPALFRQKRYGFNNELIEVYKFRSMYTDRCDASAAQLVTKQDPRVTRVGRFIRKTSLDELPQLFNVLKGDLSLVGPRPHALQAKAGHVLYDEVVDGYFARHKVKPGITGWAQINGWRGETDTEEKIRRRVEYDLYYIENWSVFFDLYILLKTPLSLLKTDNAY